MSDIAQRFASNTTEHTMTVLHDDGLYRHLRFRGPKNEIYWFDLITVPGALIFQGDGDSFAFRRITDMFAFFRDSAHQGGPNVQYWAEKLTTDSHVMRYDQELLTRNIQEALADRYGDEPMPAGLEDAIRTELLDEFIGHESIDRKLVDEFQYWAKAEDRIKWPKPRPDFEFGETWEWTCRDYYWWYLWACHAIVWGITQYDARPAPPKRRVCHGCNRGFDVSELAEHIAAEHPDYATSEERA